MSKLRVYELARELKVETKILMNRLKSAGIDVQSHQSTLTTEQVESMRTALGHTGGSASTEASSTPTAASPRASASAAAAPAGSVTKVIRRQRRAEPEVSAEPVEQAGATQTQSAPAETSPSESQSFASDAGQAQAAQTETEYSAPSAHPDTSSSQVAASSSQQAQQPSGSPSNYSNDNSFQARKRPGISGGATIVRKASPEEVQQQSNRFPQSRPAPGGGDFNRPRPGYRGSEVATGPSSRFRSEGPGQSGPASGGGGYLSRGPQPSTTAPQPFTPEWTAEIESRRKVEKDKRSVEDEEALERERKAKAAKQKRASSINTRVLLASLDETEEVEVPDIELATTPIPLEAPIPEAFQMKTVYTPSAPQRKKDIKRRKDLKRTQVTMPRAAYRVVEMADTISVGELAHQMSTKSADLIKKLMGQGIMATINQGLDYDTAALLAGEYGYEVQQKITTIDDIIKSESKTEQNLTERPPIVTIMGHVDHGKTSILDAIRESNVAGGEAGGITQHIGAYTVDRNGRKIAFLDTPGHEAFSAMRARGASVTDIVVLVVAADDGVMPQTIEAISHAKAANVPIVVAVNKIDKPNVNFDRVYRELSEHGIQSEEWGGEIQFVKVSALKKLGLDDLLSAILLQAEVLELKSDATRKASGVVIEGHLDAGRGPVATLMVKDGTLNIGDYIVVGTVNGRVRAMQDHRGKRSITAGPSTPVEVLGLSATPLAGDQFNAVADEKTARDAIAWRKEQRLKAAGSTSSAASLEDLLGKIKSADAIEVPIIIKADAQGSVEAIAESITKINNPKVSNRIIHKAVGGITESDLTLAQTTKAIIIGFNVRAARGLDEEADKLGVLIKYFSIIYDVVDAVKAVMAGQLPPIVKEVVVGHAEVRQTISIPKIGIIAGSAVTDGKVTRNSSLRLIRDAIVIYTGKISSLRRFKDDAKEVQTGYECGIGIEGCNDIRTGDVIEAFILEEHAQTL